MHAPLCNAVQALPGLSSSAGRQSVLRVPRHSTLTATVRLWPCPGAASVDVACNTGDKEVGLSVAHGSAFYARTHALLSRKKKSHARGESVAAGAYKAGGAGRSKGAAGATTSTVTTPVSAPNGASGQGLSSTASGDMVSSVVARPGAQARRGSRGSLQGHRALVLDCAYRPINVVTWSRAVMWDVSDKASVLEYYPAPACAISGRGVHPLPAVLRVDKSVNLSDMVKRVSCTRRNVLIRDKFTCQYCGASRGATLTLDHVLPLSRGGRDTWTNLVTACTTCNQRKGSKLLDELKGWRLRSMPHEPKPHELGVVMGLSTGELEHAPEEWEPWIAAYRERLDMIRRKLMAADGSALSRSEQEEEVASPDMVGGDPQWQ